MTCKQVHRASYHSPDIPYKFGWMIHSRADKRAIKILSSTYWSSSGWKDHPDISAADLAYAKSAGVMFDSIYLTHEEAVAWALRSREQVSKGKVVGSFLASLTSRRLDLRSALGSFAVSLHLQPHAGNTSQDAIRCLVCGMWESKDKPKDISVLSFERFKWGGVRHDDPIYIGFDLQELAKQPEFKPTLEDFHTMRAILDAAREMPEGARLSDLVKALASILPSNVAERRALIGILGYCAILVDPVKPNFLDSFPHYHARKETPWVKDDWPYPVRWWTGIFGVNEMAVRYWFPSL